MGRYIYSPKTEQASLVGVMPVVLGGTGASNLVDGAVNLSVVQESKIGTPGGPVRLDANGLIPVTKLHTEGAGGLVLLDENANIPIGKLPSSLSSGVSVRGPASLYAGQLGAYTVTNHDSNTAYSLSSTNGGATISGNTINYTAGSVAGVGGFSVNGRNVGVTVLATGVNKPTITTPVNSANVASGTLAVTTGAFGFVGVSDTHLNSTWEISTDPTFATITNTAANSTISKTSWSTTGLLVNTTYYIRVRHKGTAYGNSPWSDVVSVLTNDITVSGLNSVYSGQVSTYTITNYDSATAYSMSVLNGGSVSRSAGSITYTAGNAGNGGFVINGKTVSVTVMPAMVATPNVTSPVNAATGMGSSVTATSSAFGYNGSADTHQSSSWQIATDAAFTSVVQSLTDSTTSLLSWTATGLMVNTTYYVRVRHKGTTLGYGQWSAGSSFITKTSFIPQGEVAKFNAGETTVQLGRYVVMSADGNTAAVYGGNTEPTGYGYAWPSSIIFVFRKSGSSWSLYKRLTAPAFIDGYTAYGKDMALSADGSKLIASFATSGSSTNSVRIVTLDASGTPDVDIPITNSYGGGNVLISSDGTRIAFSGRNVNNPGSECFVRVYDFINGTWTFVTEQLPGGYVFGFTCGNGQLDTIGVGYTEPGVGVPRIRIIVKYLNNWGLADIISSDDTTKGIGSSGTFVKMSSDGKTLIAHGYDSSNSTKTFVFVRSSISSPFTLQAKIEPFVFAAISADGNTIVAVTEASRSKVTVYSRTGTTWANAKVITPSGTPSNQLGSPGAVALNASGDSAIVGDGVGLSSVGQVYVFA